MSWNMVMLLSLPALRGLRGRAAPVRRDLEGRARGPRLPGRGRRPAAPARGFSRPPGRAGLKHFRFRPRRFRDPVDSLNPRPVSGLVVFATFFPYFPNEFSHFLQAYVSHS